MVARELKLSVGALNVRLHPHSPELYDRYLQALYALKQPVKLRGDRFGMITLLNRQELDNGIIHGMIRTFTKIDFSGQWFDEQSLDEADPDLLRQINIPKHAHPNSAAFRFSFNVKKHTLTFEHYSRGKYLVAKAAYKLIRSLSDEQVITSQFGAVSISIVQDRSTLDRIFKLTRLKRITFVLDRPNPDIWSEDLEDQLDVHLGAVHAQRLAVTYTAPPGGSLAETPSLRRLGSSALQNGEVEASGYEGKAHVDISTLDNPRFDQASYDPEAENEASVFDRLRRGIEAGQADRVEQG